MKLGAFFLRWVISLVVVTLLLLFIDPQYFDRPLAEGTAGLPASEAPAGPFATLVGVEIPDDSQMLSIFLKSRDATVEANVEFLDQQGAVVTSSAFVLAADTPQQKVQWTAWNVAPRGAGKHALRLTQNTPGRVAIYFYQGPFWERMLGLPFFLALINLVVLLARHSRKKSEPVS